MAQLGKMDADLVCPSRLESAVNQGVSRQHLGRFNVRDRLLAKPFYLGAAPPAIAAVADEEGRDSLRRHATGHNREITADDGMSMELFPKSTLSRYRAGEDDQPARFFVETLNNT
jgi:hypothetical protein